MTTDPTLLAAAMKAVDDLLDGYAIGDTPEAETLARTVLDTIPEAVVEEATLYALRLDHLSLDEARFGAPGGFTLTMHRGEWEERGRPTTVWITLQETLYAS